MTGKGLSDPAWVFTRTAHLTWGWTRPDGELSGVLFPTLEDATANAATHGFDPLKHYWVAVVGERTTLYRPRSDSDPLSGNWTLQFGPATENEETMTDETSLDMARRHITEGEATVEKQKQPYH